MTQTVKNRINGHELLIARALLYVCVCAGACVQSTCERFFLRILVLFVGLSFVLHLPWYCLTNRLYSQI